MSLSTIEEIKLRCHLTINVSVDISGNPISLPRFTRLVITGYEVPLQATMKARLRCHLTAELEILGKCISDPC